MHVNFIFVNVQLIKSQKLAFTHPKETFRIAGMKDSIGFGIIRSSHNMARQNCIQNQVHKIFRPIIQNETFELYSFTQIN